MQTVMTVVGARPQFIKAAPVSRALRDQGLREIIVHTGQHFDALMSEVFFEELDIPKPAHNLEVNSLGHGAMTGRMLEKLETLMQAERPDMVLVYGDTNSTLAGALSAVKLGCPIAHVEAGLRSFNRSMPEEINRIMTDHASTLLFCPTSTAIENLAREGITSNVYAVGDVMFDTTLSAVARGREQSRILDTLALTPKSYSVATLHRAENTDHEPRLRRIIAWLEAAARERRIIVPIHPRTRKILSRLEIEPEGIQLVEPLGYLDMAWLAHNALEIYTDSGGLQKEAYFHRVPCVTLRNETEWVETIDAGWNRLWIDASYVTPRRDIPDYGDGHAAPAIARHIAAALQPAAA